MLRSNGDIVKELEYFEEALNTGLPQSIFRSSTINLWCSGVSLCYYIIEVTMSIRNLHSRKATEVNEIRPEMVKALDKVGVMWLTCLFCVAWRAGALPLACRHWVFPLYIYIYISGPKGVSNYRRITLLSLLRKVYTRVLERRLSN